jgi:D-beta-D-heptose 7-phosphate kinase / D-beta-D-heptose 1-phosphate adenosyltransferase
MNSFEEILLNFKNKKIIVIGDLMLDEYIYGDVTRVSPEAPIPVLKFNSNLFEVGGAGNVASNIASLEGNVYLFSFVGKDREAEILEDLLIKRGINCFLDKNEVTTHKKRLVARMQHLIRIDKEETSEKYFSSEIREILLEKASEADFIIISDYAKGVVTSDLMELLNPFRNKIIIDPKPANLSLKNNPDLYKGVFLITPNEKESFQISESNDVHSAGKKLREKLETNVMITRAEKGMILFSEDIIELPTYAREAQDITGAGDTMIAAIAIALASGANLEQAVIISSNAAAIAVEKRGTYSVTLNELQKRIFQEESKILNLEDLKKIIEEEKKKGRKVVWTNGCFDIYSRGQKILLEYAAKEGHILIVGLDSDESVRALKGIGRPINSEKERADILSSIEYVNYVTIFPPGGVKEYLKTLKPDVYVKGGDYNLDTINQEERKIVEEYGGKIKLVGPDCKHHTTDIIKEMKK